MPRPSGCVFCSIVAGAQPAHRVWEDEAAVGFLDVRPLFPGHVLLVPRAHHETLMDLPADELGPFMAAGQALSRAVAQALGADGIFNAVNNGVSQSVPHLHLHVVPRRRGDGLRGFFWPRRPYDDEAHAARVAADIRAAVSAQGSSLAPAPRAPRAARAPGPAPKPAAGGGRRGGGPSAA